MLKSYRSTITACFMGYIIQGIVNNFAPLLFITFQSEFDIPLSQITALITVNFFLQLLIDLTSAFLIDKIGYRASAIIAHVCAAAGLALLTVLPSVLPNPFVGLLISVIIYAVGGGFLEVIVSPIVEACPNEHKERTMSMLHSFYCWGSVGVIALSSLFFSVFGVGRWRIVALIWAAVPIFNAVLFLRVPLFSLVKESEKPASIPELIKDKTFWLLAIVILCSGAAELSIAQWSSSFVESALKISKQVGDIVGPALFAVCMGASRFIYGKFGDKISLYKMMVLSGALCIAAYLIIALVPVPAVALVGMGLSGFSVGILWPGTYSLATKQIKRGGNVMFSLLALAGDFGCMAGPTLVGLTSDSLGGELKYGILFAIAFPAILVAALLITKAYLKKKVSSSKLKIKN